MSNPQGRINITYISGRFSYPHILYPKGRKPYLSGVKWGRISYPERIILYLKVGKSGMIFIR